MPGRPKYKALEDRIESNGGDSWLWDRIESGSPVIELAKTLHTTRGQLYQYFKASPERQSRYKEARATSAHALVEDALQIGDDTEGLENHALIASAKERAGHRRWLAERYNRPDYGTPDANLSITLNMASVHLDTLKAVPSQPIVIPPTTTTLALPASSK